MQIRSIRNMMWIFNSQDFFEKQKIKEDKFLWVSFVIFLVLRAEECIQYASMQHVNSVWIMHVSLTCFWTFFSICKTYKVTFSIFFPLIKSIFAKVAIYFYYMSRGEMDFIHARTRVVSWGHKSVLLVTTFLGLHLGDICS